MLIPIEGILFQSLLAALSEIITIYIHKAVSLTHFRRGGRYDINRSPCTVCEDIHSILNTFLHLLNMLFQEVNTVRIMNASIRFHGVQCTEAVFSDHQRNLIAIPVLRQTVIESQRIHSPLPWCRLQIWILFRLHRRHIIFIGIYNSAVVIRNREEFHRIVANNLFIPILHLNVDISFLKIA